MFGCLDSIARARQVPESPALMTKARGAIHAERFAALVAEEEAAAEASHAATAADEQRAHAPSRTHAPIAKPALTIPVRARGVARRGALTRARPRSNRRR